MSVKGLASFTFSFIMENGAFKIGKNRDLFKKIRDTKGTFHAKMGSIKDRNGMDLTEAEDNKKRWEFRFCPVGRQRLGLWGVWSRGSDPGHEISDHDC